MEFGILSIFTSTVKMELKTNDTKIPIEKIIRNMINNINSEDNKYIVVIENNKESVSKNGYAKSEKKKRCFNNAIETSIIGFKGKLYNVKFFSSSKMTFQLAGSIEPDFSDAIDVFSKLVDYFNMFCLNGEYQPISLGDINSKMMNFKFIIKLEKDTLLDMKIFSDMLTLDEKVSDICSPNEENMLAVRHIISFKFNNSLVKMFPSSGIIKINILGTSSHNCANEIYSFICDIVKNGYDTITYKRPLTDEELLQNSIVN